MFMSAALRPSTLVLLLLPAFGCAATVAPSVNRPAALPVATPTAAAPTATTELTVQHEDYARARAQFHTRLLWHGPAPQRFHAVSPPATVRAVDYAEGRKAWLSPAPAGKSPAVLFLHGGFSFGQDDWEMAAPFRDAGFVVMTPILRGENGQPGDYTLFYDEVDDVLAAADYLAKLPFVDPSRIFVAGHSIGGTLTLLAAQASNRFAAAAAFSGSPDQRAFLRGQERLAPFDLGDMRELQLRSPLAYAESFKCPTRLYRGDQESFFANIEEVASVARTKGLDVAAVVVPGNHYSALPEEIRRAIELFTSMRKVASTSDGLGPVANR
jgi:acetyl esterase/lipase